MKAQSLCRRLAPIGAMVAVLAAIAVGAGAEDAPRIDPTATWHLERMGDYLSSVKEFSFEAEVTWDGIETGDHLIQLSDRVEVVVRRPDKLWVNHIGDVYNKRIWYDGKNFTMMSLFDFFYATARVPANLTAALDEMNEKYDVSTPIVDFVVDDPYESLMEGVKGAMYVGLSKVEGVYCHHLSFVEDDLDWQVWIEDGKRFVPRKFSVTYKNEPGAPTTVSVFKVWDFSSTHPDRLFEFEPPDNARRIEFLTFSEM